MTLEQALKLVDGIYNDVPEEVYHAIPYFSASYAKDLIQNPALAQIEKESKKCFDIGSAIHALKLEGRDAMNKRFAFLPGDAPKKPTALQRDAQKPAASTSAAIMWWELFEKANAGKIIMTADDREIVEGCVKAIDAYPCVIQRGMFENGMNEVTIIYTDPQTGIRVKSRLDNYDDGIINDLKTTIANSDFAFRGEIRKRNYRMQLAAYRYAVEACRLPIHSVQLCAVSKTHPHPVFTGELDEFAIGRGETDFCRALDIELECRQLNYWPNIALPPQLPSILAVYDRNDNGDIVIKSDHDLWQTFGLDNWENYV